MLHAFGAPPAFAVVVLAYFVGQVGNTIPIPGAVSGGIVGVLVAFAVPADLALVSVLAYRAIAIWLPAPIGLVALGALRRTMARWSAEDAVAEAEAPDGAPAGGRARAGAGRAGAAPVPGAGAARGMRLRPATSPALPAEPARVPRRLLALGVLGAVGFALVTAGVVRLPDLEGVLTDLSDTLGPWTYALVAALAFLETGAFVGLIAPGETAIVLGGVVAAEGGVDLPVIIVVAWLAAALGDLASFALGQRLGRRFLVARGPRLGVTAPRLERVEAFFDRHGPKAILVGRFIGIVRAVAPFLAGASGMRLRDFLPWSLLGTFLWATAFTLVGYAFHASFASAAHTLTHAAFGAAVLAAAVLAFRAHRQARAASASGPRRAGRWR